MIRRPPRSTLFPTRRSSDLLSLRSSRASKAYLGGFAFPVTSGCVAKTTLNPAHKTAIEPGCQDRKSTRLNSSHGYISYAVFCLKTTNPIVTSSTCSHDVYLH